MLSNSIRKVRDVIVMIVVSIFSVIPVKSYFTKVVETHEWLFSQGTRVVEFLNASLLIGFTMPFLYNYESIMDYNAYKTFILAEDIYWWVGMIILGVCQVVVMLKKSIHSNQASGYIMIVSGWVWGLVVSMFIAGSPPLTTAPVVYGLISFICTIAGLYVLSHNKKVEDIIKKGQ